MNQGGSPSSFTPKKKNKEMTTNQGGSPSFATLKGKTKRWWRVFWLVIIFYIWGGKKTKRWQRTKEARHHLLHLRKKNIWGWASWLIIIFCTWEKRIKIMMSHEACRHLLHLRKKPKDLFFPCIFKLFAIDALVIFWRNVFYNTILTSSIAPLQHYFYNIIFCIIVSTSPLQHFFLQQHFNIASIAPPFTTSLMPLSGNDI